MDTRGARRGTSRVATVLAWLLLVGQAGLRGGCTPSAVAVVPQAVAPVGAGVGAPEKGWDDVERLVGEQKLREALAAVVALRQDAAARGAEAEWTRALAEETRLRIALHGYEGALGVLNREPWPPGQLARCVLHLLRGQAFLEYLRAYGWEVRQRERVAAPEPKDVSLLTADEIVQAAEGDMRAAWGGRHELGDTPVSRLATFFDPGTYPEGVRGTLRDAVSYLFVELLADSSWWRPEQAVALSRLPLEELLAAAGPVRDDGALADPGRHPLDKLVRVLADLEAWHAAGGRRDAALEARLERLRRLHEAFTDPAQRQRVRVALEDTLAAQRDVPWWTAGQALLAEFLADEEGPDSVVRARDAALAGARRDPDSVGGRRCRHLVATFEAPEFELSGMASDGPARPSLRVQHRNVERLYFRAYPVDLLGRLGQAEMDSLLPEGREVEALLASSPAASWTVALPGTPDLRTHTTYVTPPELRPGTYVIVASLRADFARRANRVAAVTFIQSELVMLVRGAADGGVAATVVAGRDGRPRSGVSVALYRYDWRGGHRPVAVRQTGDDGVARFAAAEMVRNSSHFLLAQDGEQVALADERLWRGEGKRGERGRDALVFTDRSVYRPGQTVSFKAVVFSGDRQAGRLRAVAGEALTVQLVDANGEVVSSRLLSTNSFGSCWGEFQVPTGRLLGRWGVRTSLGGFAPVQVEEYKRPTFEVVLQEPREQARLERPVTLTGEARYYFGLPLGEGTVRWRVVRQPEWRYGWWGRPVPEREERVVASGVTELAPDGTFSLTFVPEADSRGAAGPEAVFRFRVEADVTDPGGETRSCSRVFRLGRVAVTASVDLQGGFVREGMARQVRVLRADLDGAPRPGKGRYRLIRLRQPERTPLPAEQPLEEAEGKDDHRFATPGDAVRPRWDHRYTQEAVLRSFADGETLASGELVHDQAGEATLQIPRLSAGCYRLRYETTDDFGAVFTTAREFLVGGMTTPAALPAALFVERTTVEVGESLAVLAVSGFPAQTLYLEVHRDGRVEEVRRLVAGRDGALLSFPVGERDRGGFALRLWAVRDHQLMVVEQQVVVPWKDRELHLSFARFREVLRPGQRERFQVRVTDPTGKPVGAGVAELLAYMYDRSLDLFAPHQPPGVAALYPRRATLGWQRATLKGGWSVWSEDNLPPPPPYPELLPDRLRSLSGYGIGGPGRRRFGALVPEGPMLAMADRATVPQAEEKPPTSAKSPAAPTQEATAEGTGEKILRTNFAETAFFLPSLVSQADGSATIEFQVPDSVTAWNLWVHAITADLRGGSVQREVRTIKELMVRPYLPRFFREGDVVQPRVVIDNASTRPLAGQLTVRLSDPLSGEEVGESFGLDPSWRTGRPFQVPPGGATTLAFEIHVPPRLGEVVVTATATTEGFADGEARPVAVLPGRLHLAQSRFAALPAGAQRSLHFADLAAGDDPTLANESLVVTVDAQLFYAALAALPYLVDYPYECTEQLLNRFLSPGILTSLFAAHPEVARMAEQLATRETPLATWDTADPNRGMATEETPWLLEARGGEAGVPLARILDPRVAGAERDAALAKLRKAQTGSGGFPWWPGGPPSPYMTLYLMHGFAKAAEFGVDVPREVVERGWQYLARHVREDAVQRMLRDDCCWEFLTYLNYVASCYPDPAWMGDALTDDERRQILDFSFRHWRAHSPYLKGMLALTLARAGRKTDAALVFDSVMDSAITSEDEGTHWAEEERSWLWYNDTIETHAQALRTLAELSPGDPRVRGLVQWLMLNRKLNHWHSTKATAEVLYALAHVLAREGRLAGREEVAVEVGGQRTALVFEPDRFTGAGNRIVVPGASVGPGTATVLAHNRGTGLAFVSATWHFATDRPPAAGRGDLLQVRRQYFIRERQGSEVMLRPLADGDRLAVGDEVEVRLVLAARHPVGYVHVRDPRPGGCEPAVATSGFAGRLGLVWYQEVRDSGVNFFFEELPQGEFTLSHRLRATTAGTFRVAPAVVQSMYAPEFVGHSAGATLAIDDRR